LGRDIFDISIVKLVGKSVDLVACNGVDRLGGTDFDYELRKLVKGKYLEKTGNLSKVGAIRCGK